MVQNRNSWRSKEVPGRDSPDIAFSADRKRLKDLSSGCKVMLMLGIGRLGGTYLGFDPDFPSICLNQNPISIPRCELVPEPVRWPIRGLLVTQGHHARMNVGDSQLEIMKNKPKSHDFLHKTCKYI